MFVVIPSVEYLKNDSTETIVTRQLATQITILVLSPSGLCLICRSIPITSPSNNEAFLDKEMFGICDI